MMSIFLEEHRPTSEQLEARFVALELFAENTKQDLLSIATGVAYLECHCRSWSTLRPVVLLSAFAFLSYLAVVLLHGGPLAELAALLVSVVALLPVVTPLGFGGHHDRESE